MSDTAGTLYVVATPIGNLGDISARAITILQQVAFILAEDTRHTGGLLQQLGISTPMRALHEHNEKQKTPGIIAQLKQGDDLALVSDAGTPLLSDPGYFLLRRLHEEGLPVSVLPGPCALTAALSVAGMATDSFVFNGFLPERSAARLRALQGLQYETRSMIFYEAPHRIVDFITDAEQIFGAGREAMIARELTKKFEQIKKSSLGDLSVWLTADNNHQRGEFVIIIAGNPNTKTTEAELSRIIQLLPPSMSLRDIAKLAAEITGSSKNKAYQLTLTLRAPNNTKKDQHE